MIRSLKLGPKGITGFGKFIDPGWDYQQTMEFSDLMPEQGTAPDDKDAR